MTTPTPEPSALKPLEHVRRYRYGPTNTDGVYLVPDHEGMWVPYGDHMDAINAVRESRAPEPAKAVWYAAGAPVWFDGNRMWQDEACTIPVGSAPPQPAKAVDEWGEDAEKYYDKPQPAAVTEAMLNEALRVYEWSADLACQPFPRKREQHARIMEAALRAALAAGEGT